MADQDRPQLELSHLRIGPAADAEARELDGDSPFRILVMGDFSGRGAAAAGDRARLAGNRPQVIDRDNFEQRLEKLDVQLQSLLVATGGQATSVHFRELEDFEPDRLFESVDLFAALRGTRRRLLQPESFAEAAEEVKSWRGETGGDVAEDSEPAAGAAAQPPPSESRQSPPDVNLEGLLDAAVAETRQTPAIDLAKGIIDVERLVAEVVAPYVLDKPDPAQAELVACVDQLTAELMRSLLHHPRFQALEAAWRSLFFLVRRLETDASLKIYFWDVTRADLVDDLVTANDLSRSQLYKQLVEQTVGIPGGVPWGLIVGDFEFDATEEDALLAGCLATIAASARSPVVSAANSHLFGCESLEKTADPDDWQRPIDSAASQAWRHVRNLPAAASLGLVAPRFLLRTPYGPRSNPIDAFEFEEIPEPEHDAYLWGNSSFAVATQIGMAFARDGWRFQPAMAIDLEGLPLHVFEHDGESTAKPCAEVALSERALETIAAHGVMPMASLRDQDRIRRMCFCSMAADGKPLSGPWDD